VSPAVTLERRLGLFGASLFGLSYICPTVVISTFGLIAHDSAGAAASAYLVATFAMLLTALSYGRMAARYPQAGSAYAYLSQSAGSGWGFLTGWVLILDYFFVPMVICLFTAKGLELLVPAVSFRWWIAAIATTTTLINLRGIALTHRVNVTIMLAQLAVIALLIAGSALRAGASLRTAPLAPFLSEHTRWPLVLSGASIAAYSFLGFDAVTTLAEETVEPTRNIPRATVNAAAICGLIYVMSAYVMSLAHPAVRFADLDNGGYEVMREGVGPLFTTLLTVVMIAYAASVMCAQAASARLLYALGRDGWLPGRLGFHALHPRWRTPFYNVVLVGAVMLIGEGVELSTAAQCVNFGAFCAFLAVNLAVLALAWRARGGGRLRWLSLLQPVLGALATLWLLASLHLQALIVGTAWSAIGLLYGSLRARRAHSATRVSGVSQ